MNILKIGMVLLFGTGLGFGVDKLIESDIEAIDTEEYREDYYGHMNGGYCHQDGEFFEHMLEDLNDEDFDLVSQKIDEMLLDYNITYEDLFDDYEIRHDFMTELMEFLDANNIDYHNHNYYDEYPNHHNGMGMH